MRTIAAVVLVSGLVGACAGAPIYKAPDVGPVATGPDTVEAVRRQLEGRWALLSLNLAAEDGRTTTVDAAGDLTLDGYGNLSIEYRLSETGREVLEKAGIRYPNPVISTTGRAAIDTQNHIITYIAPDAGSRVFDQELAERRANPFALERPRYYTIGEDGTLTLTTRHDSGKPAATSRWKRT